METEISDQENDNPSSHDRVESEKGQNEPVNHTSRLDVWLHRKTY